jgi:hypothetical protein
MNDPTRFIHLRKAKSSAAGSEIGRGSMFIRKSSRSLSHPDLSPEYVD